MMKDITFHVPVDLLETFFSFLDVAQATLSDEERLLKEESMVLELVKKVLKANGREPT